MDRSEKSSKRSRDERDRDRSLSSKDHHRDYDRDREHKHRHHLDDKRNGDDNEDGLRDSSSRRHRDGDHHRSRRHRDRSRSEDREKYRDSVERGGRGSQEELVEKVSSRKRKDHGSGGGEDADEKGEKRVKVLEDKREKRFDDRVVVDEDPRDAKDDPYKEDKRKERRHKDRLADDRTEDRKVKVKVKDEPTDNGDEESRDNRRARGVVKEEKFDDVRDSTVNSRDEKRKERGFKDKLHDVEGPSVASGEEKRKHKGFKEEEKNEDIGLEDFEQKTMLSGKANGDAILESTNKSSSRAKIVALEKLDDLSEVAGNTSASSNYPVPFKVSFTTTNENEGVNIIRSDEVPGKSSTDGATTSAAGKSGNLSLNALAKAKRALQMQKELAEKLKKLPALGKLSSSIVDSKSQVGVDAHKLHPSVLGTASTNVSGPQSLPSSSGASASAAKQSAVGDVASLSGLTVEAVKRAQEVAARMGFHQDPQFAPLINMFPGTASDVAIIQKPSKAPVLRLDAQGREIDEHGNVINMTKPTNLSTLKVNINKQKKEAFQILRPELDTSLDSDSHFDQGLGINKTKLLRPKRMSFQFVEEGKWSRQAEITRFKSQFGEARAKELKTKQAQLAKAKAEPDINPNLIEISERVVIKEKQKEPIPEIEWWDMVILPSGSYSDNGSDKLNMEKITIYIEHPLPIHPPAEPALPPPQPLKLTKKENKKLRTQRRLAKERDRQEMIRQGLIEPPKPKVKMSNLMKVLGSEATQDPTRLEMEIRSAAAEREQAHVDRNIARKLTPAERREKKERKLFEESSTLETIVTIYRVNHISHPKTRFQVDVNAQENRLTGCAVISDGISVVVVEGGKKSNKRYNNLMLKRIDWSAAVENDEEGDNADASINKCSMVWQGSVAKPNFNRFIVHQCRTEAAARKVFADAGVPHYWDLAVNYSDELM